MSRISFRPPRALRSAVVAVPIVAALLLTGCSSNTSADGSSTAGATSSVGTAAVSGGSNPGAATSAATAAPSAGSSGSPTDSATVSSSAGSSAASSATGSSSETSSAATALDSKGCITSFNSATDYYPVKQQVKFAKTFTISYHRSYQVITVSPPGGTTERYVLVHCGAPKPALTGSLAGAQLVTTPVSSLYSASTTHLPSLVELGTLSVLTGVSSAAFVSEKPVLDYIGTHKVVQFSPKGSIDAETVIKGKPQLLVEGGFPDPADTKLKAAGVPVLQDQDSSEIDPLGEAEWIKFFAALTGKERTATDVFGKIVTSYQHTATLVAGAAKVQIVPGNPYQGSWYVPGGKSYKAKLFADAGGTTAWATDTSTSSIKTNFEQVFARAAKAPVWLAATTWTTEKQALAEDPRLSTFAAFAAHNVWDPVKGVTAAGGNPAYELAAVRPDLMLGDLVAILHPDLLPHHTFAFYAKLS